MRLLLIAVLAIVTWKGYEHFNARTDVVPVVAASVDAGPESAAPEPMFRCDGRQHCSQMTSRAEAEYFVRHCPDTRMDGDRDGVPCENDSRFWAILT